GLAIRYYENALKECSNLELMKGYFNCCHHESSFVKQLEISLEMYRSSEGCMFLFWSVFSIQLQVCHLLLKEYLTSHKLDEPETFLVYISAPAHHDMTDPVLAIMSKLGPTLLVAEVGSQRVKGVRLCAHLSDYIAAAEVLGLLCGSSYQLNSLNEFMVESDRGGWPASSPRPLFEICKLSQLCNDR
ncbi:hypothetical protein MKW94_028495, partial [Papaver nudicaule]|nr:hypothetical protein [Papaver nudicaule]